MCANSSNAAAASSVAPQTSVELRTLSYYNDIESTSAAVETMPVDYNLRRPTFDEYRLHLYNHAFNAERLLFMQNYAPVAAAAAAAAAAATTATVPSDISVIDNKIVNESGNDTGTVLQQPQTQLQLGGDGIDNVCDISSMAIASGRQVCPPLLYGSRWPFTTIPLFHHQNRLTLGSLMDEPKPQHSYIGLIAMAILSSPELKLVLSDIYQYILDNYPYFRSRGPGWRNSIRHNLSLNDCFVKAGRSANGKGHYWAVHPANITDFRKGDFRRRKAQRKVRKHMGLTVENDGNDSPSPPPVHCPSPPPPPTHRQYYHNYSHADQLSPFALEPRQLSLSSLIPQQTFHTKSVAVQRQLSPLKTPPPTALWHNTSIFVFPQSYSGGISKKRQFDVASLLAPDEECVKQKTLGLPRSRYISTGNKNKLSNDVGRKTDDNLDDEEEDEDVDGGDFDDECKEKMKNVVQLDEESLSSVLSPSSFSNSSASFDVACPLFLESAATRSPDLRKTESVGSSGESAKTCSSSSSSSLFKCKERSPTRSYAYYDKKSNEIRRTVQKRKMKRFSVEDADSTGVEDLPASEEKK